jgi:AcrR family transcriptional regulator
MRRLLMDAALECLVEHGYAGTTTTVVADRAGVSRGAQLHHFPTRADLVAAAVEYLFDELTRDYRLAFAELAPRGDRLTAAIELLWSMFTRARFAAVVELYTAARTDRRLHAALLPIAERHRVNVRRLAHEYFPDAARAGTEFDDTLAMLTDAMHGMVVSRDVFGERVDLEAERRILAKVAARLIAELEARGRADA